MASADDVSRLASWAKDHGCVFRFLKVASHPLRGGYGLFNSSATAGSDDDSLALVVPSSLIISIGLVSEAAQESEELAAVLSSLPDIPTLEPILAIFLLYQLYLRRLNVPSKWTTYLDFLPKSMLLPITWNEQEIDLLVRSSTSISQAVLSKLAFLKSLYTSLQQVPGWFQSISWDDFILAESWVSSRTIESPRTKEPLLVPILDMANHSTSRNAAWKVMDKGIELRREPLNISVNEEVTISYDWDRGTGERLYRYGFIEDLNSNVPSKAMTLFDLSSPPRVRGGNVFRITLASVEDRFTDLSFLSYENW
jgi:hypothetical protein